MDKREAYRILELVEGDSVNEIKKSRDRLAKKWHPDKNKSPEAAQKMQQINKAYEVLTQDGGNHDNSDVDEDAIWLMKQKIKNALDNNNVTEGEMEDETVKHYEEKLRRCKTKEDLEKFTSEVVFFIRIYARARDAGYFDKKENKPKPTPSTETRSDDTDSTPSTPKYTEFTCDWCKVKVGSDDPRPKYTFTGSDKAFCCEECRNNWDKDDRWWKEWDEKKKKEAQEWEEYRRQQDQKWTDYFRNSNTSNYQSYSTYTSPSSSGSGSSLSTWLEEYQKRRDQQRSENLTENKKRYIRDVEFKLRLKKVSESKLNSKLGVSDWRGRIKDATDDMEAWSRKFEMENLVDKLSREYTCAKCGAVKDNYYPYKKGGKKYCSLECQNDRKGDSERLGELEKEVWKLKDNLKGLDKSVGELLRLLVDWVKREGVISVSLDKDSLVIKKDGKTETLKESSLTPAQQGLKKYLERSGKNSLNRQELESLVQGAVDEEKNQKRKDMIANIGGAVIIVIGLILFIWLVARIWKKVTK